MNSKILICKACSAVARSGLLLCMLILVNPVEAQDLIIEVGEPLLINEDTTWSGDVLILDIVEVNRNVTLTIAPGTTITFGSQINRADCDFCTLDVYGKLVARTQDPLKPIVFKNPLVRTMYLTDASGQMISSSTNIDSLDSPPPQVDFSGVEFYGLDFRSSTIDLAGINTVSNSYFYDTAIYLTGAAKFENNSLLNSSVRTYTGDDSQGDKYRGHFIDFRNNSITWNEEYTSNIDPLDFYNAYNTRIEGNNIVSAAYRARDPFRFYVNTASPSLDVNDNYFDLSEYSKADDFFWDEEDSIMGGKILYDQRLDLPNPDAGWSREPSLVLGEPSNGGVVRTEINLIDIIVLAGVVGPDPVYLSGLTETVTYEGEIIIGQSLEYNSVSYQFTDVSPYVIVVERNGSFTEDFGIKLMNVLSSVSTAELRSVWSLSYEEAIIYVAGYSGGFSVVL